MAHTTGEWRELLPAAERERYRRADFGRTVDMGMSPAIIVVDMTRLMYDPLFAMAPEEGAPEVVAGVADLLELGRAQAWPVFWTLRAERRLPAQQGVRLMKFDARDEDPAANEFAEPLVPTAEDLLIHKPKPSGFFDTPMRSQLAFLGIDTVIVCGMSTSGCVRATVTDAYSSNYRVIVCEEATGDRSDFAHRANLWDIEMKYGTVMTLSEIRASVTAGGASR